MNRDILTELVTELTGAPPPPLSPEQGDGQAAAVSLVNLIRQAPLDFDIRRHLLDRFTAVQARLLAERQQDLVAVAGYLHGAPIHIPVVPREPVDLPSLDDDLDGA